MASRSASALAALALAALSTAAALSFGRVFDSGAFVAPVLGAVWIAHGLGAVGRRRGWSIVKLVALSIDALAAYVVWGLERGTTTFAIPTGETLDAIARHLSDGYHELRTSAVPAAATPSAVLLAVVVCWAMAATSDVLALRRHATVGAIAPSLALFIWASALGTDDLRLAATAAYAVAALLFLLLQHQAMLERGRSRFAGRRLGIGSGLLTVGVVAGVIAVLGGLVLGPAIPGADAGPLLDVRGLGQGGGRDLSYRTETPLVRLGDNFTRGRTAELFTVRSPRAEYWRTAALDQYTGDHGGEWTLAAQGSDEVREGLQSPVGRGGLRQRFKIIALDGRWMPAAYEPLQVEGGNPIVVTASTTLVTGRTTMIGLDYTVTSRLPPGVDKPLTDAQRAGTDAPLPPELAEYTKLPGDFPRDVRITAAQLVTGAQTPYDRALALEQFFLDPGQRFRYSLDVDLGPSAQSESAVREFLRNRVGFCVQFAGAYATMARAVGLPARVAVGFTPGTYNPDTDRYQVATGDAHAWPEVWLAGLGWTRFEPTPATGQPGAGALPGRTPVRTTADQPVATTSPTGTQSSPSSSNAPSAGARGRRGTARVGIEARAPARDSHPVVSPGWVVLAAVPVAAAVAVLGGVVAIIVTKRRRARRRRYRDDPVAAIAGAWQEVLDRLGETGLIAQPSHTPFELAAEAPRRLPPAAASPLHRLAERYTASLYGPSAPDADQVLDAWRQADAVTAALAADAGVRERWRRRFDPAPLRR